MAGQNLRGIAVVDVGYTNSKVILHDRHLQVLGERKLPSPHHKGQHYGEIDVAAIMAFVQSAIRDLDKLLPIDRIVPCAHGACIISLKPDGSLAVPAMDYMSEPPAEILEAYTAVAPGFAETFSPQLPVALLHAMQLFWQSRIMPKAFAQATCIMPLMQYVAFALGGRRATEISSLSCQSHLVDMRTGGPSSLAFSEGWATKFPPLAKAWEVIGSFPDTLQGEGLVLAGVHDSNANFLRYLASGEDHFTLLSTGTWIIGFDTQADMAELDPSRDIVANQSVFGKTIACGRFFGGKEFELVAGDAAKAAPQLAAIRHLVATGIMALPSFTDTGGPMPGTAARGRIIGTPASAEERVSLATLYCALMVSETLDALHSQHTIIVDGPFSQNPVFLQILASLRPSQQLKASTARDGTAAGAACLALMPDGEMPVMPVAMHDIAAVNIPGLKAYQAHWQNIARSNTA